MRLPDTPPPRSRLATAGLVLAVAAQLACVHARTPGPRVAAAGDASATAAGPSAGAGEIRLVLFLVVDQARADYFDRFRPLLRSGLDRLLQESVWFTEAYHDHALSKTAPGHATLSTGSHPRRHGIVDNAWIERGEREEVESIDDDEDDVSPRRLLVPGLGDWIKAGDPRSRVFAVGGKDRSAVLLGGHRADGAFWYDEDVGSFTSSSYYPPGSLEALGDPARWEADRWFGALWAPVDPAVLAASGAGFGLEPVDRGLFTRAFPHTLGGASAGPDAAFFEAFDESPFKDELTGELAAAVLQAHRLGQDDAVDLLAVSFSGVDHVGHAWGPDSPELADTLLRLDRVIGALLEAVDREVGLEHVVVSLGADHGVTPIPAAMRARGGDARTLYGEELACVQGLEAQLSARHGAARWVLPGPFLSSEAMAARGVAREQLERLAQEILAACPGVERVWTRGELAGPAPPALPHGALFYNAFHPERSPDLELQLEPHVLGHGTNATTHGSVYDYDRHVPWLLRLPAGATSRVTERVATVDVAPTIASLLGIAPTAPVDGVSRAGLLPGGPGGER